jgi:hypothetical protein
MKSSFLKKALPHLIAVLVFLIVAVVYCRPALQGKVVGQSDVLQWKQMAQQSFEYKAKYGHFPLWTESTFGGMPAYTIAMGNQSFIQLGYLSNILSLGLPEPVNFFFLACICFYLLMAVMGINPWIGILASLAYSYSTYDPEIVVTGHVTKMAAIAYAPGIIAGIMLLFRRKYFWGATVFALFFAFQLSTAHLQIVYYTMFAVGILTLFFLVQSLRQGEAKPAFIAVALMIVSGLIAFGTSTSSTLPVAEYSRETMRGGRTELARASSKGENTSGLTKDYAFQWSYGVGETLTLAVPNIYGGGSGGKEIGDNSKFADKLQQEFGVAEETALQYANGSAYWGAQPFTTGPVYLGAVICLLAILGLVFIKGWQKWAWLTVSIVGIVLAWGKNFPALNYFIFDHFPFYNKFRAPAMTLVLPQLAFPVLAALGLNELIARTPNTPELWKGFKTTAYITGGLLLVLVGFYFMADFQGGNDAQLKEQFVQGKMQQLSQGHQPGPEAQQQAVATGTALVKALASDRQSLYGQDLLRTIVLILIAGALLFFFLKGKIKPLILIAGLIVLSSFDLLAVATRYLSQDSYTDAADFESASAPTPADQQIKNDPDKNFRVLDESSRSPFTDARASYFHNSLGGYSPAKLGLYQDLIDSQLQKGNMQVYNMLNTKYIIQSDPRTRQLAAQLNPNAFGPCWLVKAVHYVKDGSEEMKALDSINVRDTAIVQQQFASIIKFAPVADSTASIKLLENLNDKLTYKFSAKSNQFAVFSEIYYDKGWNVYLDGKQTDYCRVDYVLRGMPVPAGDHTIEFRFEPRSYAKAGLITGVSTLLIYLLLIAAAFLEWRSRKPAVAKS